jgi:hypothetical protein
LNILMLDAPRGRGADAAVRLPRWPAGAALSAAQRLLQSERVTNLVVGLDKTENTDSMYAALLRRLAGARQQLAVRKWVDRRPITTRYTCSSPGSSSFSEKPGFVDYLFLPFNTSTAFSPTDVPVLSHWAKVMMMTQSSISLGTVIILAARAVNIL